MARSARYRVLFRRRREGRTDYKRRRALLQGGRPRVVVRRTNTNIAVQVVGYAPEGDRIVAQASGREVVAMGLEGASAKSLPAAYLTGVLVAKRARDAGVEEAVLDVGRHFPQRGGRLFAVLKGAVDGGLDIPHGEDVLPDEERLKGGHIDGFDASKVDNVKQRILGGGS